jgi:DNA-3-methyladenine glycosylase II
MTNPLYFPYGTTEIEHLKSRDKKLGAAVDLIGPIKRAVNPDLFSALIKSIVGQQISTKAQATVWQRLTEHFAPFGPETLAAAKLAEIQGCGMSLRKAEYIQGISQAVYSKEIDLNGLKGLPDKEVISQLTKLRGVGVWTAEMLLIFSIQRPDVVSFGDLAIQRGMRMLYRHRKITRQLFEKYRRRYSPYGTTASLYLWALAGGALPDLTDPAPKR